jgi:GPH family glycoside/pentoside/hexuronide:cation symporter
MYFVDGGQIALLFVLYGVQQFFMQMASPILWSMIADTADYGEFLTGRRITGLTFSGALLALKFGTAVGGALLGWLLAGFGYESQAAAQSADAIWGIVALFTLAPVVGHSLLIVLVRRYRLTDARCDEIRAKLEERSASTI